MLEMLKSADFWFAICSLGIIIVAVLYVRHAIFKKIKKSEHSDNNKR